MSILIPAATNVVVFTEGPRCWQHHFSADINHAAATCAMTDGFWRRRGRGTIWKKQNKNKKQRGASEELNSPRATLPTSPPHFQPPFCAVEWPPPTEAARSAGPPVPVGRVGLSENTGRPHAGRLMERRRVCEVHWPLHTAPHALVLQNGLTYHMWGAATSKSGVTAPGPLQHWWGEVASGSCCSHPVRLVAGTGVGGGGVEKPICLIVLFCTPPPSAGTFFFNLPPTIWQNTHTHTSPIQETVKLTCATWQFVRRWHVCDLRIGPKVGLI